MVFFDRNFKEIFISQLVSITGGLIVGTILASYTDKLLLIPGMLILLPGFLEMRGNISGSLASRLSSGLFLKVINPRRVNSRIIKGNVLASLFLAIFISFMLGILACVFTYIFSHVYYPKIILVPVIAGIIANMIEIPLTIFFTLFFFRKGHDPNNIMGPFVTSTGDVTSVLSLLLVLFII